MIVSFHSAQDALGHCKTIVLPRPEDVLWIVTDGSVKNLGISATLYCRRENDLLLGGFFNAKLKHHQVTWLPCEVEAFCIGAAVKHFAPFIIQSRHQTQILTDSRPCVQACAKLQRGASPIVHELLHFSQPSVDINFMSDTLQVQLTCQLITQAGTPQLAQMPPAKCASLLTKWRNPLCAHSHSKMS